jgi:superfamily II DNA or RNA helicase
VDECHRAAGSPTALSQFYKVLNNLAAPHKYGLSATVHRADGMIASTYALLGPVVHEISRETVADKIMPVAIKAIPTEATLGTDCLNTDGTLCYTKIVNHLCNDIERNVLIVKTIDAEGDRPSLILSDRIEHLETLMAMLPDFLRLKAVMIDGKMTSKKGKLERQEALENMRSGRKKYLFATYKLAKEGLDVPCLERLYLTTPQTDYAIVTQSIGRIARTSRGKEQPVCIDFVDKGGYFARSYKKRVSVYKKSECIFL